MQIIGFKILQYTSSFFFFTQAALERFSVHEKNAVKKPKSATASWKHSGQGGTSQSNSGTGAALNLSQLKREGLRLLFR